MEHIELWQLILGFLTSTGLLEIIKFYFQRRTEKANAKKVEISANTDQFDFYTKQISYWQTEVDKLQTQMQSERDRSKDKSKEISGLWQDLNNKNIEIQQLMLAHNTETTRLTSELNGAEMRLIEAEYSKCVVPNCQRRTPPRTEESEKMESGKEIIKNLKK